ncbi:MAG: phasin family protein [Aeromonadales bacterium]|nr:phasin family protein [Aeromonadales bacterium]
MSLFDFTKLQAVQQNNLNLVQGLANNLFAGATKLGKLQQDTLTELHTAQNDYTKQLFAVRDVKDFFELQSAFFSPSALLERQLNFNREVVAVLTESQQQVSQFAEQQASSNRQQFNEALEQLIGQAPVGAEAAVSVLKNAIASANEAYEKTQAATKNAADIADQAIKQAAEQSEKAAREAIEAAEKNISQATATANTVAEQTKAASEAVVAQAAKANSDAKASRTGAKA